jgi:hypothetical protein
MVVEIVSVTSRRALFLVGGQLRRSRSAQAVSDAKKTNRIKVFFMVMRFRKLYSKRIYLYLPK